MYSKEAMDLYEQLLTKVATDVQFELMSKEADLKSKFLGLFRKPGTGQIIKRKPVVSAAVPGASQAIQQAAGQGAPATGRILRTSQTAAPAATQTANQTAANVGKGKPKPTYKELQNAVEAARFKIHPAMALLPAAGVAPIAYSMRDKVDQTKQDWDKLKYGVGGLGVGLALPYLYDKVSQGGMGGLLNAAMPLMTGGGSPSQISDFSSI
jgi:hypothetical protein